MKVKANRDGFYKGYRVKGEVFEIASKDDLGAWMDQVDEKKPAKSKKPETGVDKGE